MQAPHRLAAGAVFLLLLAQGGRALAPRPTAPNHAIAGLTPGLSEAGATAAWMAAVWSYVSPEPDPAAIERGVLAAGALDPSWRAPWRYGALMLGALGAIDAHERVLLAAIAARPDDPWFPHALGMSRYLNQGDREGAAAWLRWAATLPDAPPALELAAERIGRGP